ncbi:FAD-binding oxidoreductase, partial [bacterium]|nr:FAD-binding oxidoreductase [bacterium]
MELSAKFLSALEKVVGPDNLLTDPEQMEKYSRDETPELSALPDAVVLCQNAEQVAKVVEICYEHDVPITPRGAGTGVAGGAVPVAGG